MDKHQCCIYQFYQALDPFLNLVHIIMYRISSSFVLYKAFFITVNLRNKEKIAGPYQSLGLATH